MTSLNQNFSDFANILMQRRQMQQQQAQNDRANRLADLQYNWMQREDNYQTGLQNAMQNPGVVTNTTIAPDVKPSLANLIPGNQLQAPQFQQPEAQIGPLASRVQTTTTPRSPAQAGAEYALLHNKPADYKTYTDLNKAMLTQAAQAKIYGSPEQAAQIETELEKMTKGATLLSSWKKAGGIQFAKAQAAKMPQLFQGTNLDNMSATDAINTFNLPNGQQVVWSDDNPGQLHLSAAPPKQADVAHNVIEIPSANGKTAQKFQYNAKTERYDIPVGGAYAVKSQVPNINVTTGKGEKDIPTGVQEKLQSKIELAQDWGRLRDTFDPSFVPKSKFKTLAEFETNLQRIFSGNQPAIDWWMGYFDARNILMKDRSGAAVTEPEFRRFEQGAIRASDSPQTIVNQLNRAAGKYEGHAEAFISGNEKNHPEGVKSFVQGMGYQRKSKSGGNGAITTKGGFKVTVVNK